DTMITLPPGGAKDSTSLMAGQPSVRQPAKPLESLLNKDGTLNLKSGFSGSLDSKGWHMETGPGGQPRFVRAGEQPAEAKPRLAASSFSPLVAGDENWDDRFGAPGVNGAVQAIAISGT